MTRTKCVLARIPIIIECVAINATLESFAGDVDVFQAAGLPGFAVIPKLVHVLGCPTLMLRRGLRNRRSYIRPCRSPRTSRASLAR